jgi:ABC-type amino acid transport substrate-binding protein
MNLMSLVFPDGAESHMNLMSLVFPDGAEQAQRLSNELREFDKLLADREYQRRIDKWNKK